MPEPPVPNDHVGALAGSYRLIRELGRGGMGIVYEAVHEELGQRVAVKVMATHLLLDPIARQRFFREAQASSQVQHPSLVRVFDQGALGDGTPYLLMELLSGESLRARLEAAPEHRLPAATALRLCLQVAEGMLEAHARGILHRDLKPDNLWLVPEPAAPSGERIKVLDFGIAHFLDRGEQLTQPAQGQLGTLAYMSPERCRGDKDVDGRTDVYSLGCILYEALCGQPPFVGEHVALLHQKADPVPPSQRAPSVARALDRPVLRLLARDPATRPTMAEAAALLQRLLDKAERGQLKTTPRRPLGPRALLLAGSAATLLVASALRSRFAKMAPVTGGSYQLGRAAGAGSGPVIHLSDFRMDKKEVTCREFLDWLNSQKSPITFEHRSKDNNTTIWIVINGIPYYNMFDNEQYNCIIQHQGQLKLRPGTEKWPVSAVTWAAADTYCIAHGKRLPSEAQWEYAATNRGTTPYPWGSLPPSCGLVTAGRSEEAVRSCGPFRLEAAASKPWDRTQQGIYDLGGSVSEWVDDCYQESLPPCPAPCRDRVVRDDGEGGWLCKKHHVTRGGAWSRDLEDTDPTRRDKLRADWAAAYVGFRCVKITSGLF